MRAISLLLVAAVAMTGLSTGAAAKPLETEQFKSNAAFSIDPSRAYILVRSPGMDLKLLRVATAAERGDYERDKAEAFAKAKAKYERDAAKYAIALKDYETAVSNGVANYYKPEQPIEPTEANFAFRAIESDNFVTIWAGRVFDKGGPRTVHLIAVPPGTYRVYGQILEAPNGSSSGTCMCMGSVQFDAAAGTITDMGTIHYPLLEARADKVAASWNGLTPGKGGLTSMRVEPSESSTYVPAQLASMARVPASYRAAGKVDNFFGVMIDRLTSLPGVLTYRRDEIIDERTGSAVASN
jgi:hypothetical protein